MEEKPVGEPPARPVLQDVLSGQSPVVNINMEDRVFLEEFGRRITRVAGVAALLGGTLSYGLAKHQGWRRRGLWTMLGGTVSPFVSWYFVVRQERDQVIEVARRLHAVADAQAAEGAGGIGGPLGSKASGEEAIARLFPPPPSALAGGPAAMPPPRGLPGGPQLGVGGLAPPLLGGGSQPPGSGVP
mmetsp:Transcript_125551/g.355178  ORF Transcript_125551/g.355178 Transcript_125551/m.355178 type:complete len:186 (+) Transcript_125551:74-631(+)